MKRSKVTVAVASLFVCGGVLLAVNNQVNAEETTSTTTESTSTTLSDSTSSVLNFATTTTSSSATTDESSPIITEENQHKLGAFMPTVRSGGSFNLGDSSLPRADFIDVSSHQGNISVATYQAMKNKGVKGVVVKLTESTTYQNPYAKNQITNAKAAGLKVSAYHFSWFTSAAQAKAEAHYFASFASSLGLGADTVMVNDFESASCLQSADPTGYSDDFSSQLKSDGYGTVVHYSSGSVFDGGTLKTSRLNGDRVWVAGYPYSPSASSLRYTDYATAWQWSSSVNIDGMADPVDVSIDYNGIFTSGVTATAAKTTTAGPVPTNTKNVVYRIYNSHDGQHFYSTNATELNGDVAQGWNYEGVDWTAPSSGSPVYRLYNTHNGDHFYTSDKTEADNDVRQGWTAEGVSWYSGGKTPIYRIYNPNAKTGAHHYTANRAEAQAAINAGWRDEGVAFYGE